MDSESTQYQQAQLAAILGADPAPFETLISHLMSTSNEQRSQAESIFNLIKQNDPNSLALKLANLLTSSPHIEPRAMSAILLRKLLTRDDSFIWPKLTESTRSGIKSVLLTCIQREESKSIIKKLCDTVSELASSILPENQWPEMLPFMFQCVTSDSPKLQESAFLIFAQLAQYIGEILVPYIKDLHSVFLQTLNNSPNPDVRIAALSAVINFIQCLSSSSERDRFQDLLPAMMKTLTEALNSGQEATAQEALELLIELAGTEPRFLRRQLVDVVGAMLQVAEAESLEEGTRHLAIEFVITLAEARERAPGMMRKLPQFISRLFAILMKMLLDVEDEAVWHSAEAEHEDAGETSNYSVGQECLDRLAIALGGNTIVPVASEQLPSYLAAPEWQKHHAALIALAQIAEGCSKVMIKNLEQVVNMVLNSFQDPHPRVRWAAINAIGQLSTDLGPDLQVQYHNRVLPALAAAMDDFQNPRVQAHAASAVLNFSENCTPEILTPYLDGIVSKLLVLLQNGNQMVQEGALTALASVADSSQEHFQKYYDAVMPYLKTILVNATDKSNRMLRAKAMECISLVGMAVGKDKFRDDAKQVMEVLMSLQGSQMETDDPTTSYMLQAWARLCKCLGQDFLPYMSVVMPPLLQSAQLKPDVTISSADSDNELDDSDDDSMETITLGDKRIGIKTSVLEEKATACNMLCCYADELKEGFYPCTIPIYYSLSLAVYPEIMAIKVHGSPMSTATMRVAACLIEKELDFEFVPVDMASGEHKKHPYLSLNPFGQVPAFEDGDLKLFESRAITQYIAHVYADNGYQLILQDPKKMPSMSVWMEVEGQKFEPPATKLTWELGIKPIIGMTTDDAAVKESEAQLSKVLDIYETRLAESKYLGGDSFTLVDLHHIPNIYYLMSSKVKEVFDSRPRVSAWCADILARPAWVKGLEKLQK